MTRYPATSRPIERAEPSTIFMADSIESQLRSFIFFSAISRTCALVTAPALSRPGGLAPLRFGRRPRVGAARRPGAALDLGSLLEEEGHRRRLHLERERTI